MRRLTVLAAATVSLLMLRVGLPAGEAVAQQKSLKEQLVGTWMLVSSHSVGSDGSKLDLFGSNPKRILIYTSDGHFALVNTRSTSPRSRPAAEIGGLRRNTRPWCKDRSPTSAHI